MIRALTPIPEILKGETFTARMESICRREPRIEPLDDLKYRRILIPGLLGGEIQFALLTLLGHALRMRGAEVTGLLCDEFLPACTMKKVDHHESACTRWCYKNAGPFVRAARLPHHWYSEFVSEREKESFLLASSRVSVEDLIRYEWHDILLGEHISRSVESYFKVGKFDLDNPVMVTKGRNFLASAMCMVLVGERSLDLLGIDKVFMEDGKKIEWGVLRSVALRKGIPVDVITGSPRGNHLLIEHDQGNTPCDPLASWSTWRDKALTREQETELDAYFIARKTRPYENHDWTELRPTINDQDIRQEIGLPDRAVGHVFGLFPNLGYDAGLTKTRPMCETASEWVVETIRFFAAHPEHHLIVKVHPGERLRDACDPTVDLIRDTFGATPPNVHVVGPDTDLTAHDVVALLDVVVVYTSTIGLEAAYFGKPVINVGGGLHAGRGISIDCRSTESYFRLLTDICTGPAPTPARRDLARRYAYAVFFRSVLPVRFFSSVYPNVTGLHLDGLDELAPGQDDTIDTVCRGVLCDEPFHRDAKGFCTTNTAQHTG